MTGIKVLALAPLAAAIQLPDILMGGWEKLGLVGLLILAVVAIWRDGGKRQDKLEKIIASNTAALAEDAETRRETNALLVEFKNVIAKCRK